MAVAKLHLRSRGALLSEYGDSPVTLDSKKLLEIYKRYLFLSFQVCMPYDGIVQTVKWMEVPLKVASDSPQGLRTWFLW